MSREAVVVVAAVVLATLVAGGVMACGCSTSLASLATSHCLKLGRGESVTRVVMVGNSA